ncbi:hypothetical protein [Undibacterium fentianense]|uniref:Uncharacterized protein n=1 Tax=Undibacterium fentianense TaxID=2828728 RepID=A0A941EAN6_9BURK|nr:hypothetical protein [Undibacterium fentianense]MBR7801623.1 hypothetical protein [Undibacterium fentianense]
MKLKTIKVLSLAAICVAAVSAMSLNALARPAYGYTTFYFSDASKTEAVGELEFMCSGRSVMDGVVTPYTTTYTYRCN